MNESRNIFLRMMRWCLYAILYIIVGLLFMLKLESISEIKSIIGLSCMVALGMVLLSRIWNILQDLHNLLVEESKLRNSSETGRVIDKSGKDQK